MNKDKSNINKILPYLISLTGISFWFIIGFPFSFRNEAYSWITHIEQSTFWISITERFTPIITFRPLSQVIVWTFYRATNGEIYLIQLLNFFLLLIAFITIVRVTKEKFLTSTLLLVTGFLFISAYYYIFQLQGIFYSPLILYTTFLILKKDIIFKNNSTLVLAALITLILIAIHTYAVIIFELFLLGSLINNKFKINPIQFIVISLISVLTILFDYRKFRNFRYS